jgi:TonB family protein
MTFSESRLGWFFGISFLLHILVLVGWIYYASFSSGELAGGPRSYVMISMVPGREGGEKTNATPITEAAQKSSVNKPVAGRKIESNKRGGEHAQLNNSVTPGSGGEGFGQGQGGNPSVLETILGRIDRAKQYPLAAKKNGWEGKAQVSFTVGADGRPGGIKIVESSGVSLLDEEALATIIRASPYPAYPELIKVQLKFELQDQ